MIQAKCNLKCSNVFDLPQPNTKSYIVKWEWEVLAYEMLPYLESLDMIRLQRASKGFKECVDIGANHSLSLSKQKCPASKTIWNFINPRFETAMLKKSMLERFTHMSKKGLQCNYKSENSKFCNDEASVCMLLFYLRERKPRALNHLLHCIVPRWSLVNRRLLRRMHLKIEMYFSKLRLKKTTIKQTRQQKENCMSDSKPSVSSVSISELNENRLPNVRVLTESNLEQHERLQSNKRKRSQPLRQRKKPKSYADEYQTDVQVQDDFREYSDDSPVVVESIFEARSVDSRSEGSLKDFIVKDDDEEVTSVSNDEESEHDVVDYFDSDDDSCCTSDLSGVFSDDD